MNIIVIKAEVFSCLQVVITRWISATYMRQWIRSALVKIMAYRLVGTKPLSEPMLEYYQLDPKEQTSVKF